MTAPLSLRVPATTANLGPGFDTFGLALHLFNRFAVAPAEADALLLAPQTCVDVEGLSLDPAKSLIFRAMDRLHAEIGRPRSPLAVTLEAHVPLARGLGSSSTALVAGLLAANRLAAEPLDMPALVRLATDLEGHPDNVAAALLGGAVLCDGPHAYPLPWPESWRVLMVVPPYRLLTEKAREVLRPQYPLADAVFNLRKASLLVYALLNADADAFRHSLDDALHQPYRAALIPEFAGIRELALAQGGFGAVISGAGPAVAVFCPDRYLQPLRDALQTHAVFGQAGWRVLALGVDRQGAHFERLSEPV